MSKIKNILNGWQNFIEKSEVTEQMAEHRANICVGCEFNRPTLLTAMIKDKLTQVKGNACTKCSCPLSAKIRSVDETCPMKLW